MRWSKWLFSEYESRRRMKGATDKGTRFILTVVPVWEDPGRLCSRFHGCGSCTGTWTEKVGHLWSRHATNIISWILSLTGIAALWGRWKRRSAAWRCDCYSTTCNIKNYFRQCPQHQGLPRWYPVTYSVFKLCRSMNVSGGISRIRLKRRSL